MSKKANTVVFSTILASSMLLTGCGLFGGDKTVEEIDPPKDVSYVKDEKSLEAIGDKQEKKGTSNEEAAADSVKTELYLVDKNGYVVPQTLMLPKTEGVARQALEYLVQGGPVTNMLPNGFRAVLPADTRVLGAKLEKDGTIIADFSPEFANYKAEDELKILQAITWTLTQFDKVERVKIRINGHDKEVMPVNNTPISEGLSRADGINLDSSNSVDITNTKSATVYYLAQNGKQTYYVPVTKRISADKKDQFAAVVNELVKGPNATSGLVTDFNTDVKLLDKPKYENGKLTLNFNKSIFGNLEGNKISDHVLQSLVLSLTEQPGVESVAIQVNGKEKLMNEDGKKLTEPVTRPADVNTGSF
jgi:germination protein M